MEGDFFWFVDIFVLTETSFGWLLDLLFSSGLLEEFLERLCLWSSVHLASLSLSLLGLQARSWFLSPTSVSLGIVLGPPPDFHCGSSLLRRLDLDLLLGGDLDLRDWCL